MPIQRITNLNEAYVQAFNSSAGSQTGSKIKVYSPVRGRVLEVGFLPSSLVASAMTMDVATYDNTNPTVSVRSQIVTSTLGTFASTNLVEGACASVVVPSPAYVNPGDAIEFTTSGGNTSAIGATVYAVIKKG